MAVIDVSFDKDEQLVGLPNLECLKLSIYQDKKKNEVVLFDIDEASELMRISNTSDHQRLLKLFAYIMDNKVRYQSEQAFENGLSEGYRTRSLEIKWAIENLMKVPDE